MVGPSKTTVNDSDALRGTLEGRASQNWSALPSLLFALGGPTWLEVKVIAGLKEGIMRFIFLIMMTTLILANCAPRSALGPVHLIYPEIRPVEIELRSFSFQPNHIVILENHSSVAFRLINTADTWHNFTLLDRHKSLILTRDLKPKESMSFCIEHLDPGNYVFHCNRFLHRHKGMEGMLMVD